MSSDRSKTPSPGRASSGPRGRGRGVSAFGGPVVVTVAVVLLLGGWLLFGGTGGSRSGPSGGAAGSSVGAAGGGPTGQEGASSGSSSAADGHGPQASHDHAGDHVGDHAGDRAGDHVEDDAADPADPVTTRATLPPGTWDGSEAPAPAPSVSAPTAPSVASPTVPSGAQVDSPDGWRPVIEGFGKDWANPYGGKSAWLARVSRWCGPQLAAGFADTDINAVFTDTLTAVQQLVGGGEVADARLTYASGRKVLVRAVIGAQGWKIVTIEPDTQ